MAGNLTESNALHSITKHLGLVGGFVSETLTGATTVDGTYGNFVKMDPGGASRNVTLPAEEGRKGAWFFFANAADAAENLVIKDDAANTIVTINQNEGAVVWCDGAAWNLFAVWTIALS